MKTYTRFFSPSKRETDEGKWWNFCQIGKEKVNKSGKLEIEKCENCPAQKFEIIKLKRVLKSWTKISYLQRCP